MNPNIKYKAKQQINPSKQTVQPDLQESTPFNPFSLMTGNNQIYKGDFNQLNYEINLN